MGAKRLVPLSGVLAVVLIVAGFGTAGSTPNGTASVAKIVAYYGKTHDSPDGLGCSPEPGALLSLIFAATFTARVCRRSDDHLCASALCLVGAGLLAAGLIVYAGLSIAIADVVGHVSGAALQMLNVLADDAVFVFLITIGRSAFLLGAEVGVFTARVLPRRLGWFAVISAIVGAIPSHVLGGTLDHIGLLAFAGLGVSTLTVAVVLVVRAEATV